MMGKDTFISLSKGERKRDFLTGYFLRTGGVHIMALMEISVVPIGQGTSVSTFVAEAVRTLEGEPGIEYEMSSMGTIVSGDVDRLLAVAQKMHHAVGRAGAQRIYTIIKIDDRQDKTITLHSKLESLRRELGKAN
jgi:uncharacterized protein (TIGR00106 family)